MAGVTVPEGKQPGSIQLQDGQGTGAWEITAPSGCHHLWMLTKAIDSPSALILKIKWKEG